MSDGDGLFPGPCLNPGDSIVQGRMHDGGPYYPRQVVPRGGQPSLDAVPLTDDEYQALRRETQQAILNAYGLKPWDVGLAPVPLRIRLWRKVAFGRWRAARRAAQEDRRNGGDE